MPGEEVPEVGDQVSWAYGAGHPSGEVVEKKTEGEVTIQSKKGNTIKRKADPENPALHITRPGNDVVKRQSEVQVEEKKGAADDASEDKEDAEGANGEEEEEKVEVPQKGGKRLRETDAEDDAEKEPKKARGRPKKAAAAPAKATASAAATPAKKGKVGAPKKAEKAEKKVTKAEKADVGPDAEKKARGRPKKDGSSGPPAPKYQKKSKGPASTNGVGSRTRSKN